MTQKGVHFGTLFWALFQVKGARVRGLAQEGVKKGSQKGAKNGSKMAQIWPKKGHFGGIYPKKGVFGSFWPFWPTLGSGGPDSRPKPTENGVKMTLLTLFGQK